MSLWRLEGTELDKAQEARRSLLNVEMERLGLGAYRDYLHAIRKYQDEHIGEHEDVADIVSDYILGGYPSLAEVVKVLPPAVRCQMLRDEDCWVENDPRCQQFVSGDSDHYPNVDSVKAIIQGERAQRENALEDALLKMGLDVKLIEKLDWYLGKECKNFIRYGTGDIPWIADKAAAETRYQELAAAFKESRSALPKGLQRPCDIRRTVAINGFRDVYRERHSGAHNELVVFVLQEAESDDSAKDVLAKITSGRSARQEIVDKRAMEFDLDLDSINKTYQYYDEMSKVNIFVDEGTGDGKSLITRVAFDIKIKELGLPGCRELFREVPSSEERFSNVASGPTELVNALIQEMVDEKEARLTNIRIEYIACNSSKPVPYSQNLTEKEEKNLRESRFVRFGIGSVSEAAKSCNISFRRDSLQSALHMATPRLLCCDVSTRMKKDCRLREFVEGVGILQNTDEVISHLQEEEKSRRKLIESKLLSFRLDEENLDELISHKLRVSRSENALMQYIAFGDGCTDLIVNDIVKGSRRDQLQKLLFLSPYYDWDITSHPLCQEFIEGQCGRSCQEVVSQLRNDFEMREKKVLGIIEKWCSDEEGIRQLKSTFNSEIQDYIRGDLIDVAWIYESIDYHFHFQKTEASFGKLNVMLPDKHLGFSAKEDFKKEIVSIIQETLLKFTGFSEVANDEKYVTKFSSTKEPCGVVHEILSFWEPSFYETIRFDLSQRHELDTRIILFLTKSSDCPWQSADQAVDEIRMERRARIQQIDKYSEYFLTDSTGIFGSIYLADPASTAQDKEDDIWHGYNKHADFINGKCSLEDAIDCIYREKRTNMLEQALRDACLHERLSTENKLCVDFVECQLMEDAAEALPSLMSKLKEERIERCRLLDEAFSRAGVKDLGIGASSYIGASTLLDDDYLYEASYLCNPDSDFPWREDVARVRFEYIDLGDGEPEDVVKETVRYQRAEMLEKAVEQAFGYSVLGCHSSDWIRKSKRCKAFVVDTEKGLAADEEINSLVKVLSQMLQGGKKRSTNDNDCNSDDNNSDYYDHDYDDYHYGTCDWKDALSGGMYGNDPDTDAMWDAYWDA